MNKIQYNVLFILLLLIGFSSCKKEKNNKIEEENNNIDYNYHGLLITEFRGYDESGPPPYTDVITTHDTIPLTVNVIIKDDSIHFKPEHSITTRSFHIDDHENGNYWVHHGRPNEHYTFHQINKDTVEYYWGYVAPAGPGMGRKYFMGSR